MFAVKIDIELLCSCGSQRNQMRINKLWRMMIMIHKILLFFYDNNNDYDDTIRSSLSTVWVWGRLVN